MHGGDVQEGARISFLGAVGADAACDLVTIEVDERAGDIRECDFLDWFVCWAELFDEFVSCFVD